MNIQRQIAQHIIAHNNCINVTCTGVGGLFSGTPCPLDSDDKPCPYAKMLTGLALLTAANDWIAAHDKKLESTAQSQTMPTSEILDFLPSGSNEKTPNDKLVLETEADILLDIVATGKCGNVHCDGVDVEPWVCNTGTVCPLIDMCPIYVGRNNSTPFPPAMLRTHQHRILIAARKALIDLPEIEVQRSLARIIIRTKGCKNITCTGIENDDPTGELMLNDGVICPIYGDGSDDDVPNNCPLAVFGDYNDIPYAAQTWLDISIKCTCPSVENGQRDFDCPIHGR